MAKCQSRALNVGSHTQLKQNKMQIATWSLAFWLVILMLSTQHVRANDVTQTYLVMGDVGAIKTNVSDSDGSQMTWAQLTVDQKKVLAPLGAEWDTLRPWQREKMLDIARDYPKMDAKKQARVKERLNTWSRMTPYERENARIRYQQFHSLSPEKKDELRKKWAEHQKLPESEREKLRQGSFEYDPELD
jgi:hypothetical protein